MIKQQLSDTMFMHPENLFSLCHKLYVDPVYRFLCFPPGRLAPDEPLTEEVVRRSFTKESNGAADAGGMQNAITRIKVALENLPVRERSVLLLRLVEGMPYREIAERIDVNPDACQVMHYRAWSAFCDRLNETQPLGVG